MNYNFNTYHMFYLPFYVSTYNECRVEFCSSFRFKPFVLGRQRTVDTSCKDGGDIWLPISRTPSKVHCIIDTVLFGLWSRWRQRWVSFRYLLTTVYSSVCELCVPQLPSPAPASSSLNWSDLMAPCFGYAIPTSYGSKLPKFHNQESP